MIGAQIVAALDVAAWFPRANPQVAPEAIGTFVAASIIKILVFFAVYLGTVAMLTLLERANFNYHFSDLWRMTSGKDDTPILPELQQLHGVKLLCIYGKEEKESLCRTAPAGLMTVVARDGAHHFDGNYDALADLVYGVIPAEPAAPAHP